MLKDKTLSMLGLARRAGKLSMGHDMAEKAIKSHKAKMVIFCSDASDRLVSEFEKTLQNANLDVPIFKTDITMNEIHFSVGYKAGVMTLDDENFSKKVIELLKEE
jgi:ribosomal protein L7Ae-like RNA K-turn-binding protein